MPLIQTDSQHYSDIADAIRDMSGNEETFYPSEMAAGVRSIPQTIAIAPIIYSLEEREVGVWTDGKPLYERTIHINSLPSVPFTTTHYPHNITNIDAICNYYGVARFSNGTVGQVGSRIFINGTPAPSYIPIAYSWSIMCSKTDLEISVAEDRSSMNADIIIQYTKTTDTPGSGTWTPSGVPAHHYSTNEQVIGTWIDGKPLYEKTIVGNALGNSSTTITLFTATVEKIQKYDVILRHANGNAVNANMLFNGGSLYTVDVNGSGNLNIIRSSASAWQDWYTIVTIQYTKNTD